MALTPEIWRRIQVHDGTLDELHDHIQLTMGWTNSHLCSFRVRGISCANQELCEDDEGLLEWNGPFDPKKFDADQATLAMQLGVRRWA